MARPAQTLNFLGLLLVGGAIALSPQQTRALDPDLGRFAAAKQRQLQDYAETLTNKLPSIVWSFFDAVRVDDWETATNLAARLDHISGRFPNSFRIQTSPALRSAVWAPISEMIGAYEEFHKWNNKWLHRFGREIIDSIPRGSVYFGGTDPGRFLISALSESHSDGKPFFTLTQNQLADLTYLQYLRKMYGQALSIPSDEDSQKAFEEYITDAQERLKNGKLEDGEDVRIVNGRVQVSGQVAIMKINGLLVKIIMDKNTGRQFYLEESFPLTWMYSHLSPHGLIFELHRQPLRTLSAETMLKDQAYWKKFTTDLIGDWIQERTSLKEICDFVDLTYRKDDLAGFKGDPSYARDEEAQKCFSKLRSSIAGLYSWRADQAVDPDEKQQAQKAADLAFRQAYALCPFSPEVLFRYTKLLLDLKRPDDAILAAKTSLRFDPENKAFQDLVRSLTRAE